MIWQYPRAVVRRGVDAVVVDLAADATPERPPTATFVGPALHPDELAGRKLVALFDRAEARDFADVYVLAARYGTGRLIGRLLRLIQDSTPAYWRPCSIRCPGSPTRRSLFLKVLMPARVPDLSHGARSCASERVPGHD
jgi:hypothetical protein